jgi:transposase
MQTITTIGFDIAKSVFQVHGVDAGGQVLIRRQLKRRQVLAFFQKLQPVGALDLQRIDVGRCQRKSRNRAISMIRSADKTAVTNSDCGVVCISYR